LINYEQNNNPQKGEKMKKIILMVLAMSFAMGSTGFSATSPTREERISEYKKEIETAKSELKTLQDLQMQSGAASVSASEHSIIAGGAAAVILIRFGQALKVGQITRGVFVQTMGEATAATASGETVVVVKNLLVLNNVIKTKVAQLNRLQDQLDAMQSAE
jgi:hypothetical protein